MTAEMLCRLYHPFLKSQPGQSDKPEKVSVRMCRAEQLLSRGILPASSTALEGDGRDLYCPGFPPPCPSHWDARLSLGTLSRCSLCSRGGCGRDGPWWDAAVGTFVERRGESVRWELGVVFGVGDGPQWIWTQWGEVWSLKTWDGNWGMREPRWRWSRGWRREDRSETQLRWGKWHQMRGNNIESRSGAGEGGEDGPKAWQRMLLQNLGLTLICFGWREQGNPLRKPGSMPLSRAGSPAGCTAFCSPSPSVAKSGL